MRSGVKQDVFMKKSCVLFIAETLLAVVTFYVDLRVRWENL